MAMYVIHVKKWSNIFFFSPFLSANFDYIIINNIPPDLASFYLRECWIQELKHRQNIDLQYKENIDELITL
jgi:hypothetical protein